MQVTFNLDFAHFNTGTICYHSNVTNNKLVMILLATSALFSSLTLCTKGHLWRLAPCPFQILAWTLTNNGIIIWIQETWQNTRTRTS